MFRVVYNDSKEERIDSNDYCFRWYFDDGYDGYVVVMDKVGINYGVIKDGIIDDGVIDVGIIDVGVFYVVVINKVDIIIKDGIMDDGFDE